MKAEHSPRYKYVRIRKLGARPDARHGPGDPHDYRSGEASDTFSLPANSCAEGWLLGAPALGEPVRVLRVKCNGVPAVGYFHTTAVTVILGEHHFGTANSLYAWEEVTPP